MVGIGEQYLIKKSSISALSAVGGVLGAGAAFIGNEILNSSIENKLRRTSSPPSRFDEVVEDIKGVAGLRNLPHSVFSGLDNAAYIPPGSISSNDQREMEVQADQLMKSKGKRKREAARFIRDTIRFSKSPKGGMVFGKKLSNPWVAAHEIGHAVIENEGSIHSAIQKYSPTVSGASRWLALGSLMTMIPEKTRDLGFGLGLGALATGALGYLGKGWTESEASRRAKGYLEKINLPEKERLKAEAFLDDAWKTYMMPRPFTSAIMGSALTGMAASAIKDM